jgi:hypothetical protein
MFTLLEPGDRVGDTIYRRGQNGGWWWGQIVWIRHQLCAVDAWVCR